MIHPFTIAVDQAVLTDLLTRLANTRWPDQVDNDNWQVSTEETYLQDLCSY